MNAPPCTACGAPGQVVITLDADGRSGSISSCRACFAAVLMDMAEATETLLDVVAHG